MLGTSEQIFRIAAYTVGAYFLGDGVASSEMFQSAVGGVISLSAFVWWSVRQYKTR